MRKSSIAKGLAAAAAILTTGNACNREAESTGQLVLSVQTDMALPQDVDCVGIQILTKGVVRFNKNYAVGFGGLLVPATLAVVAGSDSSVPVTVRVVARQDTRGDAGQSGSLGAGCTKLPGRVRVLREAVSTIPTRRVATLRLPIQWLCDGSGKPDESDPSDDLKVSTTCPEGQTCNAGACVPVTVPNNELDTYTDGDVFGTGGDGSATCFDTVPCFADGFGVDVEPSTCSIAKPSGGAGVNVALVKPISTDGICNTDSCLIPLDAESDSGWRSAGSDASARIVLPSAVCDRIADGSVLGVAVTTSCATKTPATPTCGTWSSVGSADTDPHPGPATGIDKGGPPGYPPPPWPDGAPPPASATDYVVAVSKFDFVGASALGWQSVGYNLDHKATVPDQSRKLDPNDPVSFPNLVNDVCQPYLGKPAYEGWRFEGRNGIDNAFGAAGGAALTGLQKAVDANAGKMNSTGDWVSPINAAIAAGEQTLLIHLGRVGANDNYIGLSGGMYVGGSRCAAGQDGGACAPKFDGQDTWPPTYESVVGADPQKPRIAFPSAYMTGRYWVSGAQSADVELPFTVAGHLLTLKVHKAVVTMKVDKDGNGTEGVFAGILRVEDAHEAVRQLLGGVNSDYCDVKKFDDTSDKNAIGALIRGSADIMKDGTQDPGKTCDGVSFGFRFEAKPVKLAATSTQPASAPVLPCPPATP